VPFVRAVGPAATAPPPGDRTYALRIRDESNEEGFDSFDSVISDIAKLDVRIDCEESLPIEGSRWL